MFNFKFDSKGHQKVIRSSESGSVKKVSPPRERNRKTHAAKREFVADGRARAKAKSIRKSKSAKSRSGSPARGNVRRFFAAPSAALFTCGSVLFSCFPILVAKRSERLAMSTSKGGGERRTRDTNY